MPGRIGLLQQQLHHPLLVSKAENLLYLTGTFFADPAHLLVFPGKKPPVLFGGILEHVAGVEIKDRLQNIGIYIRTGKSIEIEDHVSVGTERTIRRHGKGLKLIAGTHPVERMRLIKDAGEIELVRRSMHICEKVLERVKRVLKKKTWTEIDLARFIRIEGLKFGADGVSFEPIVAAGINAAVPHHKPGGTLLKPGQSIVLDFGFKVDGYCSDFTRTVFIRNVPARLKFMYESTEAAFHAALLTVGNGIATKTVDAAARDYLASKKLDKHFIHGLGHGTGLEVHEAPRLSPLSKEVLQNGMVFSIEPGVYIPRVGGIRIEDLVYLEKGVAKRFILASTSLKNAIIN